MPIKLQFVRLVLLLLVNTLVEFLPVSSTAHSIIFNKFLKVDIGLNALLAVSQLAVVVSLLYNFRGVIVKIIKEFFFDGSVRMFCYNVALATMPSVVFGLLFHGVIRKYFHENVTIAIFLAVGGMLMAMVEKYKKKEKTFENSSPSTMMRILPCDMYKIGLIQAISLIPGLSRSACTVGAALFLGLPRAMAVDFSFFLSIPVSIAGSFFDLWREFSTVGHSCGPLSLCFIINLFFSLFIIKRVMKYLKTRMLYPFCCYRVALGIALLIVR